MLNQFTAVIITWVIAIVGSLTLLKIIDAVLGLRVTEGEERDGLDLSQHGETGYFLEEVVSGKVLDDGAAAQPSKTEPRPASEPPNGQRRFAVVIEGADNDDLISAWSSLCQTGAAPPTPEFKAVYPYLTTVQGNRFRFRGGEPNGIRDNMNRLFQNALNNPAIHARVETQPH
jgi:hypothetical protein